jgi:hypothetical protein
MARRSRSSNTLISAAERYNDSGHFTKPTGHLFALADPPSLSPEIHGAKRARVFARMKARTRLNAAQDEGWRGACAEFGLVGAHRGRDTRTLKVSWRHRRKRGRGAPCQIALLIKLLTVI